MAVKNNLNLSATEYQVRLRGVPRFDKKRFGEKTRLIFRLPVLYDFVRVDGAPCTSLYGKEGVIDAQIDLCSSLLKTIWDQKSEEVMKKFVPDFQSWMIGTLVYYATQPEKLPIMHAVDEIFKMAKGTEVTIRMKKFINRSLYECRLGSKNANCCEISFPLVAWSGTVLPASSAEVLLT